MGKYAIRQAVGACILLLVLLVSGVASAVDEIVVTTRKTEENLQEVPIAITTVSREVLQRTGAEGLEDITRFSPSFIFDQNSTGKDVRIAVRGLSASRGRSNVAFLVDGIDVTSEAIGTAGGGILTSQRLLGDVQRVEAVKGPQSALYGRAAFAGAINYITQDAPDEWTVSIGGELAQYRDYSLNGSIGAPINDQLGWLLNAYWFDDDGQYNNAVSKASLGGGDGYGAALTLNWDPAENLAVKTRLEYVDERYDDIAKARYAPDRLIVVPNPGVTAGSLGGLTEFQANVLTSFGDADDAQFPLKRSENPRTGRDYDGNSQQLFRASVVADWQPKGLPGVVSSLTGYLDSDQREEHDWDANARGRPDMLGGTHDKNEVYTVEIFSQELRYRSTFEGPLNFTLGANYWQQERVHIEQGIIGGLGIGQPGWQADFLAEINAGNNIRDPRIIEDDHRSIYAMLEWEIGSGWKATLENRYTRETFSQQRTVILQYFNVLFIRNQDCAFTTDVICLTNNYVESNDFCPTCAEKVPQSIRLDTEVKSDFNAPKFTLDWAINKDALVYFSVGKGVKPAGLDVLGGGGRPPQSDLGIDLTDADEFARAKQQALDRYIGESKFTSEKMWAYEIGSKLTFSDTAWGDFIFNNAVFYQDYTDKQVSVRVTDPISGLINRATINAGAAEVLGVELETAWYTPVNGLIINAAYTWLDTEYKEFDEITTSEGTAAKLGNCQPVDSLGGMTGAINSCLVSRAGNELERAPEHAFVFGASYTRPVTGTSLNWFVEGDTQYQSERWVDAENVTEFDDYWRANVRTGLEAGNWEALIFIDNVFDDDTVTSGAEIPDFSQPLNGPAPSFVTVGVLPEKRQVGLRVKYTF